MTPNDANLIDKIGAELAQSDAVIVVGSDLSRWSGLPDHEGTLAELAAFMNDGLLSSSKRVAITSADYQEILNRMPPERLARFVRQACRVGTAQPNAVHRKLVELLPSCFITTNHDCLLEASLRTWRPDESFRAVSNSNLLETAELVLPVSNHFVFKPLGDVNDVGGMVLTRAQFDALAVARPHVQDSMKTLLASRPIVLIGFRQDEPAFAFLRNILAEIQRDFPGDRFAILPDVPESDVKKWRKEFGLHVVSYASCVRPGDSGCEPAELLDLLDRLLIATHHAASLRKAGGLELSRSQPASAKLMALVRYAARMQHRAPEAGGQMLPLRITRHGPLTLIDIHYHEEPVEKFLRGFPKNALLLGNAGAGKTFSLLRGTAAAAREFLDIWLGQPDQIEQASVTIYLDLKLYTGHLWKMAQDELPAMMSLSELCNERPVRFLIDAVNETPREFIESGHFDADLDHFLDRAGGCPVVFASRTGGPLARLDLHTYHLEDIDPEFVTTRLRERGKEPTGVHRQAILSLLQKPLFFRLFEEGVVELKQGLHPREVYESFLGKLSDECRTRFGAPVDLMDLLSSLAYAAIQDGNETLSLAEVTQGIGRAIAAGPHTLDSMSIVNWLMSKKVLVPASGTHLVFFHQSLTEYLAAKTLAAGFKADPGVLTSCLQTTRWDQSLFHALGFLDEPSARDFVRCVFAGDLLLAIGAAAYVEHDRDQLIDDILDEAIQWQSSDFEKTSILGARLRKLPFTAVHQKKLEQLACRSDFLGSDAAALLPQIFGRGAVPKLLEDMIARADDWNFCQSVARELKPLATDEEIQTLVRRLGSLDPVPGRTSDEFGIVQGLSILLQGRPTKLLLQWFGPWDQLNAIQRTALCRCLESDESAEGCQHLVDLLRAGAQECIFPIYMRLTSPATWHACGQAFDTEAVNKLVDAMPTSGKGEWAVGALAYVCRLRPDLMHVLGPAIRKSKGITRIALSYALGFGDGSFEDFWSALRELVENPVVDSDRSLLHVLSAFRQISWNGRESLLITFLKKRDWQLARPLLDTLLDVQLDLDGLLEPLDWWWQWMAEVPSDTDGWFFCNRLTGVLMPGMPPRLHQACVDDFNSASCQYRSVLKEHVLWYVRDLSTDQLTPDAIGFLLADLQQQQPTTSHGFLLGKIATETFVAEKLLPLRSGGEPLRSNLQIVLEATGRKFGRRYFPG